MVRVFLGTPCTYIQVVNVLSLDHVLRFRPNSEHVGPVLEGPAVLGCVDGQLHVDIGVVKYLDLVCGNIQE